MRDISGPEIVLRRISANGLTTPFPDAPHAAHALAGIQSQFQQWAEVSIMNRTSGGLTMGKLAAHYRAHDIINLWGQRHTLHMYAREDWDRVSDLYESRMSARVLANCRVPQDDLDFLLKKLLEESAKSQEIPRKKILDMVQERMRDRYAQDDYLENRLIHLGCLRGLIFGVPEKPGITTFVCRGRILPEPWKEDNDRAGKALEDFMLRYFRYYGPATLDDFCHWSSLPKGLAGSVLKALKDRLMVSSHAGREYYSLDDPDAPAAKSGVHLLGKFDPLFVSYRHKDWIIPPQHQKLVWRSAGWVEGVLIDGHKALGTWRHSLKGDAMTVEVSRFATVSTASRKKTERRAERLAAFWEKRLDAVTFV